MIPPVLAILKVWSESFDENYRDALLGLLVGLTIFAIDVSSTYVASALNRREVRSRIAKIDSEVCNLRAYDTEEVDSGVRKDIRTAIKKLQSERLTLMR